MAKLTISEALSWRKTLDARYKELVGLRDANSYTEQRFFGASADKSTIRKPTYNVVKLDKLVGQVAREIRLLDTAIKKANSTLEVPDYSQDDKVLGEVA